MVFSAVLDAAVLVPIHLTDLLLRLGEDRVFRPLWSEEILAEVERNIPKADPRATPERAARRVRHMRAAFPEAMVTGHRPLIGGMTNHPKDRHVLAAAVRAKAGVIVTANVDDFPASACDPFEIDVQHPDDFLLDRLDSCRAGTLRCVDELITDLRRPPRTRGEFLEQFRKTVPCFVDEVLARPYA